MLETEPQTLERVLLKRSWNGQVTRANLLEKKRIPMMRKLLGNLVCNGYRMYFWGSVAISGVIILSYSGAASVTKQSGRQSK